MLLTLKITPDMKVSKYYAEKHFLCYRNRIFNNETMEEAFDLRVLALRRAFKRQLSCK